MQAMKGWHKYHPHLFVKSPRNLPGCDRYASDDVAVSERSAQPVGVISRVGQQGLGGRDRG